MSYDGDYHNAVRLDDTTVRIATQFTVEVFNKGQIVPNLDPVTLLDSLTSANATAYIPAPGKCFVERTSPATESGDGDFVGTLLEYRGIGPAMHAPSDLARPRLHVGSGRRWLEFPVPSGTDIYLQAASTVAAQEWYFAVTLDGYTAYNELSGYGASAIAGRVFVDPTADPLSVTWVDDDGTDVVGFDSGRGIGRINGVATRTGVGIGVPCVVSLTRPTQYTPSVGWRIGWSGNTGRSWPGKEFFAATVPTALSDSARADLTDMLRHLILPGDDVNIIT